MKTKLYLIVALRIVMLISIAILFTYVPDILPTSFLENEARQFWYYAGCTLLFMLNLIDAIIFIIGRVQKYYPHLK